MKYIIIGAIILTIIWAWIAYEIVNAPLMQDDDDECDRHNFLDKQDKNEIS
jgi:hypothetical protein